MMAKRTNIRRRGKSWVVHFRRDGEQFWQSFKTRDEAELHLARELERRTRGQAPERRVKVTFRVAAEHWYTHGETERNWKASTRRDYRSALDAHLLVAFGDVQLERLTAARIAGWRSEAMQNGLPRRTAEKLLAILHGIFARAGAEFGFAGNPAAAVERIKPEYSGSLDFYTPEEVWALVNAADSEQDAAIYLTAAFTGLRRGELVALRVRDVDFERSTIRVEGSYAYGELSTPKSGKPRAVPMANEVAQALARLLADRGNPGADELVFPGTDGGYIDASALRRRYIAAQTRAKLRRLRFHDLRHVFGSTAINRASIVQVQSWMGHADIKTTMRYLHHKSHAAEAELLDGAFAVAPPLELNLASA